MASGSVLMGIAAINLHTMYEKTWCFYHRLSLYTICLLYLVRGNINDVHIRVYNVWKLVCGVTLLYQINLPSFKSILFIYQYAGLLVSVYWFTYPAPSLVFCLNLYYQKNIFASCLITINLFLCYPSPHWVSGVQLSQGRITSCSN